MQHCVQINLGNNKYQFNVEVKEEGDLITSLPTLIKDYILQNKENLDKLQDIEKILDSNSLTSNSNLKKLVNKSVLDDNDINLLLESYLGNSNIYNITSFFSQTKRSDLLSNFNNLFSSPLLTSGSRINTFSYNVIMLPLIKNRIVANNTRTILLLNTESTTQEAITTMASLHAFNQLREPNSNIFRQSLELINNYNGNLLPEIKNLSLIDKMIYLFSNPNLEEEISQKFKNIVSSDISNKLVHKKDKGFALMESFLKIMPNTYNPKINSLENENITTNLKDIFLFRSEMYKPAVSTMTLEEFKEEMNLDEVPNDLYPKNMWNKLVKFKNVTEVLYSYLPQYTGTAKGITNKLNAIIDELILDNIPYELNAVDATFNPDLTMLNLENDITFSQNRVIKFRYGNPTLNSIILTNKDRNSFDEQKQSYIVNINEVNNFKFNPNITKNINFIHLNESYNINNLRETLSFLRKSYNHVSIDDTNPKVLEYVKLANELGYGISIYTSKNSDPVGLKDKYDLSIPLMISSRSVKYRPSKLQSNIFVSLATKTTTIPVLKDDNINNYPVKESFSLVNKNNSEEKVSVTVDNRIPLFHQYETTENNGLLEIGDLVKFNGKEGIYVKSEEDNLLIIDITNNELTHVLKNSNVNPLLLNGLKIKTPINLSENLIWYKEKSKNETNKFFNYKDMEFNGNKFKFYENKLEEFKNLGLTEQHLRKILSDTKSYYLVTLNPSDYTPKSEYVSKPLKTYFTAQDLVTRINNRLTGSNIEIVWFDNDGNNLPNNAKKLKKEKAFTSDGIIYLNVDKFSINSYMHELSHVILAALKFKNSDQYYSLLNKINDIPTEFISKYEGLTSNSLKEEYLVHLFSNYFTDINETEITKTMDKLSWDTLIKDIFNLKEDLNSNEIMAEMNGTFSDMIEATKDSESYREIFKNNQYLMNTKLAAMKAELMKSKKDILKEEC